MNNKRKIVLIVTTFAMSSTVLGFALSPKKFFRITADPGYTCPLPGSFVELDDVIYEAASAGTTETANTYQFRGTVTRRVGDVAYVQRVSQEDHSLYGLRVEGCNSYANSLQAGNVVNFSGGKVFVYQGGIPTFKLTASNNAVVAYATNPTGYGPVTYHTLGDAIDDNSILSSGWYNGSTYQSYYFAASRLNKICNLVPNAAYTISGDVESRYLFLFNDASGSRDLYVMAKQDSGFLNTFFDARDAEKVMDITGYYQLYHDSSSTLSFLDLVDVNDAEVYIPIDDDTITSTTTATFYASADYTRNFAVYTVKNHDDVPYVEVANFYNNGVFLKQTNHETYKVTQLDSATEHQFIYRNSLFDFTVNSQTDVIAISSDPSHMAFEERPMESGLELIATGSETKYCKVDTVNSRVLGSGQNYSFDLSKYGLDIVEDANHKLYVPLQAMNLIFNDSIGYTMRYNGKDLYFSNFVDSGSSNYWSECAFGSTISSEYAEYNYGCLCLAIEDIYGLCGVRGVQNEGADALLSRLGYKTGLKSTNLDTYERNFIGFVGKWFFEGHSGAMLSDDMVSSDYLCPANKNSSTNWHNIYVNALQSNDRYVQFYGTEGSNIATYRANSGYDVGVRFYNDTAIIIFDEFVKADGIDSATKLSELNSHNYKYWHDYDTPLFFRKAFNEIDSHGGINNVIIDLTNNGGGRNDALVFVEAYMTSDPVHTSMNRLTGMTYDVHYDVDINYDGVIDSNDTYQGTYNFYLMTSQLSFSCGNYLPTTAYVNGYATLIGQRSGGGTCCVGFLTTAVGDMLRSSSNHFLGYWSSGSFHNNESGIPVTKNITDAQNFYSNQYLYNLIH